MLFHDGSNCDYHFIIKVLLEEFKGKLTCLGENTEKYITFSALIEIIKTISHRLQFIDSARFMTSSLLNLVNNLSERIHKIKRKYKHDDKNVKVVELNTKILGFSWIRKL